MRPSATGLVEGFSNPPLKKGETGVVFFQNIIYMSLFLIRIFVLLSARCILKEYKIGIIMNGVTGRMGTNQHLKRSIVAIRRQGGVLNGSNVIVPEPVLVGRNEAKLKSLAAETGVEKYTTDLDTVLSDPDYPVYFDASTTQLRVEGVLQAIRAGKAVYCEKPTAETFEDGMKLWHAAQQAGVKNGVVQNKLWLPGLRKLRRLIDSGFFGRILSVRGEFGYWVFDGRREKCQRPSWNYRKEEGGGIIVDMFSHWRYLIDNLFGNVTAVTCLGATHIPSRIDEHGKEYECTAEDAAYATFTTDRGVVCHFNSSWVVRVRRDDLLTLQVEGTKGSAVAGLRDCRIQTEDTTPRIVWNPDIDSPIDYYDKWPRVPDETVYDNAFKAQWELFLKHVALDQPFPWNLLEAAKGLQLADKALESWKKRCWVDIEPVV